MIGYLYINVCRKTLNNCNGTNAAPTYHVLFHRFRNNHVNHSADKPKPYFHFSPNPFIMKFKPIDTTQIHRVIDTNATAWHCENCCCMSICNTRPFWQFQRVGYGRRSIFIPLTLYNVVLLSWILRIPQSNERKVTFHWVENRTKVTYTISEILLMCTLAVNYISCQGIPPRKLPVVR